MRVSRQFYFLNEKISHAQKGQEAQKSTKSTKSTNANKRLSSF